MQIKRSCDIEKYTRNALSKTLFGLWPRGQILIS
jgi:hypothetical protein